MPAAAIDFGAIEHELAAARAKAGGAAATTMNFIVYVDDESLQARADEKAMHLSEKYPARIIVLHTDREDAKVSSTVRKVGEGSQIHAERIEIGVSDLSPQAICSAVNSLRVPDIPNVLWWMSETTANEILFDDMVAMMDTVIVDSSGAGTSDVALRELSDFFKENDRVLIRDLAYLRLAPWQDMVAQFFDDKAFLDDLHRINRIEISSGSLAEGFYLVAWLASRLDWKPCGRFELCAPNDQRITVSMNHGGHARRVFRIAISTADSMFTAELTDAPDTVCLSVTGPKKSPTRCAPLQHIDNMSLLEKAFLVPNRDGVFEDSVRVLGELFSYAK